MLVLLCMVVVNKAYSRTKLVMKSLTAFCAVIFGFIALFFISSFRLPTFLGGGVAQADYTTVASGGDSVASTGDSGSGSGSGCDSSSGGSCAPD